MAGLTSDPLQDATKIQMAVITGAHAYDVPRFNQLLRSFDDVDYYIQHIDQYTADWGDARTEYDVLVFFNWNLDTPGETTGWWETPLPRYAEFFGDRKAILEDIGTTPQGVVVLHHALTAFPQWAYWSDLMGVSHTDRAFKVSELFSSTDWLSFDETLHIKVAKPKHPITQGLESFDMIGETWGPIKAVPNCSDNVLLTTDLPKMEMKAIAWTHQYKQARVFCLQPGHDKQSWEHPDFRTVLWRGIRWAAGRL